MKSDILVIIPVHTYSQEISVMLDRALASVPKGITKVIACPLDIHESIVNDFKDKYNDGTLVVDGDSESTSFQRQVNYCVNDYKNAYQWFSVLEFDDEYTPYWFDEVERYFAENPNASMFMPLTDLVRREGEKIQYVGYGNEAPWASAFSNEIGVIDFEVLTNYFDFYATGSVININDFLEVGGLKESMKLTFWYEFMLRFTNKEKSIFVVPKIGYKHWVGRDNSMYDIYSKELNEDESTWWYNIAKEECYFTHDRNKTYENREDKEDED